ncbi:hypothetical protein PPERSA_11348 [Pseudocohnilembus persalinus]|uniref:SET domain-containing protein n=1 Tax=Pseudocohnilembus persalinus TaxID=266149 RepID=A0A0V0QQC7_PSEPJ|nr:hypothetical protein PPERSA_11348 [Pseudocohnilembus persalinus]|eukprot:KRX04224.1 hypothetical protein PPERSA_11348 [Pseudocohnilembus persalinus]
MKYEQLNSIKEYLGEIIETAENQLREKFDGNNNFYSFQLTNQDKLIDGKYFGNKSRFINHQSQNPNCITKVVYSQGDWHLGNIIINYFQKLPEITIDDIKLKYYLFIGIYAQKDIEIGEELLFNYDGDGTLKSMFNWIEQEEEQKTKKKKQNRQQNINSKSNLSIEMEEELGELSFDSEIYYKNNNNGDGEDEEDYQDSFEIPLANA